MAHRSSAAARASYEKHRNELRASSLAQLQARCAHLPLTVTMSVVPISSKYEEVRFQVVAQLGVILCTGSFQTVSTFLMGFKHGWQQALHRPAHPLESPAK